jgi:hypothetical protein
MKTLLAALAIAATTLGGQAPSPVSAETTGEAPVLQCATGERTNEIVDYLNERLAHEPRDRARTLATPPFKLTDGTFVMHGENGVLMNAHYDDLVGQTLEFVPSDATHYTLHHIDYTYVDPQVAQLIDFSRTSAHFTSYATRTITLSLFGRNVTTLYISTFNGIHVTPPNDVTGLQVDDLHAFAQRDPIISPLLLTNSKPGRLPAPKVYAEEKDNSLIVTWRSDSSETFGYDVQARLFPDGTIRYSYRTARSMRWGAPVISAGLPSVRASSIANVNDDPNDAASPSNPALKPMIEITNVDVSRINDSDVLRVRIKLAGAIDPNKLASTEILRYIIVFGSTGSAFFDIRPDGSTQTAPIGSNFIANDPSASYFADTVTFYVTQGSLPIKTGNSALQVLSRVGTAKTLDTLVTFVPLQPPPHRFAQDLSAVADGTSLEMPIAESFTLPALNPSAAWNVLKGNFPVTDNDIDGVAVYQSLYTDLIFYAGAYSANGNPQVDGIALPSTTYGTTVARRANVMHMNALGYGWNSTDDLSGHVIMHEFGHRWLYFLRIKEGDTITSSLNPVSAHPAQYINTPAAFPVHNDYDASVMGGGTFTPNGDGTFSVRAANFGYSWTDLYLMGFATPEEVRPFFYVANTTPALGPEYYPPDRISVTGQSRDVNVQQIVDALGPRKPAMAASPKSFRVLFVLVTDDGVDATPEQLAAMKNIRRIFEKNFNIATGGRADVHTEFSVQPRHRSVGH